jgi:hypothetical protein
MVSNIGLPVTIADKSVLGICSSDVLLFANSKYFATDRDMRHTTSNLHFLV